MKSDYHRSVLLREVLEFLQVESGKKYIDATLGGGGHALEIVSRGGSVLGIDVDPDSINYVRKNTGLIPIQGNFKDIDTIAASQGFSKVAGIIFDLGVSSHQIEEGSRGFSFQEEGPLDMRMDKIGQKLTAADILNLGDKNELYEIFNKFGEEPRARILVLAIIRARKVKAFRIVSDLLKVVDDIYKVKGVISDKIRATISKRIFQALRIAVNSELSNLEEALPKAVSLLEDGGKLEVISFHSLEDRIVKKSFLDFERKRLGKILTKKPIVPSFSEQNENRKSRSAKLRVFERII